MIDHIALAYTEIETQLSGPIWPCAACDETKQDNDVIDHTSVVYVENEIELLWSIKLSVIYDKN